MTYSAFTTSFLLCKIPDQLANLLGFATYTELAKLVYPAPKYHVFVISKRGGGQRLIYSPRRKLKEVQRKLNVALQELDNSRPTVHGFRKHRSVVTNAQRHVGKAYVLNLDLETFFPSINFGRVYGLFKSPPFNFPPQVAAVLGRLCTYKAFLPQGAPTSPAISNFICRGLDGALQQIAKDHYATYTRYADDLTFSFSRKKRDQLPLAIVSDDAHSLPGAAVVQAIHVHGFAINPAKTRLRSRHSRTEVTGLTVNEKVNVPRRFVDEIRGALHAWDKFGLPAAQKNFESKIYRSRLRTGSTPPLQRVIRGKLLYLHMVKGMLDPVYTKLARKFNALVGGAGVPVSNLAHSEKDLEQAVFVLSACDDVNNYELKGTCFFAAGIGIVSAEHCVLYPASNVGEDAKELFPGSLCGRYFGIAPGSRLTLQDTLENDLCELEIVWADKAADLVVLRIKGGVAIPHLSIPASLSQVAPSQAQVQLIGFPFHNPGKSISIAEGKVRSRYKRFGVSHFDISPLIRKGNSGGPVLSSAFHLVGVATEGEKQEGGNNAVVQLAELVARNDHYLKTGWTP